MKDLDSKLTSFMKARGTVFTRAQWLSVYRKATELSGLVDAKKARSKA